MIQLIIGIVIGFVIGILAAANNYRRAEALAKTIKEEKEKYLNTPIKTP